MTVADAVGTLGAGAIVVTYFLLQTGRIESRSLTYSLANGLGAGAILVSLLYAFNLSAFAIEAFWLAISVYGVFRALRHPRSSVDYQSRRD